MFKIKADEFGVVSRYKARLTACGYAQRFGRDYNETYAPVASIISLRFVFALAACMGWELSQHDVDTAFLYGVLPPGEQMYLRAIHGVDMPPGYVAQLVMGLYGLKQASRLFNQHLGTVLATIGYSPVSYTHLTLPTILRV